FIAQEHVAACFEVVLFANPLPGERLADFHPVLGLNEGHVVDDKYPRLANRSQLVDDGARTFDAIAAAIKRPGTTKGAVPGAAAAEFDRRTGIQHANKIFPPTWKQIASRTELVETAHESCRRTFTIEGDGPGDLSQTLVRP